MTINRPDWGTGTDIIPVGSNVTSTLHLPAEPNYADQEYLPAPATPNGSALNQIVGSLPRSLTSSWENDGAGVAFRLQTAQSAVIAALEMLPGEEQEWLVGMFEWLPQTVQTAIFAELALGSAASVRPADDDEIDEYFQHAAGALAISGWRGQAAQNVAKVEARGRRILDQLTAQDRELALEWLWQLDPNQGAAVLRMLAK